MKQTLIFALIVWAFSLSAQADVTLDTSYVIVQNGAFFDVHKVTYSDGSSSIITTKAGDTLAIYAQVVNRIRQQSYAYKTALVASYDLRTWTTQIAKPDTLTTATLKRSPITEIMQSMYSEFSTGTWEIVFPGTTVAVTFPILSTNQRWRITPTGGTAKTVLGYGDEIRIVNYPFSGLNILFKVRDGLWYSTDYADPTRKTILRRR